MSEDKQGAAGAASATDLRCEWCHRPKPYTAGNIPGSAWCWREWDGAHNADITDCYRLGCERLSGVLRAMERLAVEWDQHAEAVWDEQPHTAQDLTRCAKQLRALINEEP